MLTNQSCTPTLLQLRAQHVPRYVSNMYPTFVAQAQGVQFWDVDGKEYIDFAGGIGVMNVGHSHPKVTQAVQAQMERFSHTCFRMAMYEPYLRLAEHLMVHGLGPMIGIELVHDSATKKPAPDLTDQVLTQAHEQGMLLIKAGLRGNVVCILVPLGIEELLISRAIETLCTVIKQPRSSRVSTGTRRH